MDQIQCEKKAKGGDDVAKLGVGSHVLQLSMQRPESKNTCMHPSEE